MKKSLLFSHRPPSKTTLLSDPPPSQGRGWAFNLATERLFSLGASDSFPRVAYRTALGEVRLLPLSGGKSRAR